MKMTLIQILFFNSHSDEPHPGHGGRVQTKTNKLYFV